MTDRASGFGRSIPTMFGPMTSSRAGPTMAGSSACSTSLTISPENVWRSGLIASSTRPTSSTSCRTCSSYAACPATFVLITGRSSSPRQCESGLQLSAPRPRSSSPEALGRTATARASTRSFATNCSTVRSSTASPRPRSSSRHGGATTTPSDHTHRSDINRRRQRPSPGLQSQPDRFRQQRKQWPKSRLCIKTETGPPHRGRPVPSHAPGGSGRVGSQVMGRYRAKPGKIVKERRMSDALIPAGTRIGHVHLKVADLERALGFYCGVLGFELTQRFGDQAAFVSAGGYHHHIGLNTWESKGGSPPAPGTTGLFHTAILYPTRAALADALHRVLQAGIQLDGASDHGVSEALYLRDPDQNGVELYWDRPEADWPRNG